MLEALLGNTLIEKILFYLLINDRCYPSELKKIFGVQLYSAQRTLSRLEKGAILISHKEGKTLIFQFNPHYVFLPELLAFLRKAYQFLPTEIKEKYYEPIIRKRPRRHGKPL